MTLRTMTAADVSDALALWAACDGIGLSAADTPAALATFLARNAATSWVAVADGRLIGTVLAGHDGRRGFLYHLAVAVGARRRGLGRELVRHALTSLATAGIEKCHVMVFRSNDAGREFWDRLGWSRRNDIDVHSHVLKGRS